MKQVTKVLYSLILCAALIVSLPVHSVSAAEYKEGTSIVADQPPLNRDGDSSSNDQYDTQEEQDRESKPFPMSATPDGRGDDY